jgi:hypothetical protein
METKRNDGIAADESIAAQPRATHASWAADFSRDGVTALLEASPTQVPVDPKALFLGPKAENADLVEQMLLEVYRDYVFWRRNFHPEDRVVISPEDRRSQSYNAFVGQFKRELFALLGELKSDIPFFSPRYIGHMLADVSLPALVGYIATMLYNPNNISWEGSPVTTLLEIQVGRELAGMMGFGATPEELAATWGTSLPAAHWPTWSPSGLPRQSSSCPSPYVGRPPIWGSPD